MAIATSLSIVASTLSIANSVRQLMKDRKYSFSDALKIFSRQATSEQRSIIATSSENIEGIVRSVISDAMLEHLTKQARDCEKAHIEAREKAETDNEYEEANKDGERCMCRTLNTVRRYNKGHLPNGQLDDFWQQYDCTVTSAPRRR